MTKHKLKIKLLGLCGWLSFKWRRLPPGVYCFNYHRIGDPNVDDFDPNVFSASVEEFESQLQLLKQHFNIISVDELVIMTKSGAPLTDRYAVITFDDGYIDNYTNAYPLLKKHNIKAAFYVPIHYIDHPQIPWWDEIAWLVNNTTKTTIKLNSWTQGVALNIGTKKMAIRRVLEAIKKDSSVSMATKLEELRTVANITMPEQIKNKPLFMNWQQLKTMSDEKMHIGSHGCSHNILSYLSEQDQIDEVVNSKERIEQQLNIKVTSLAYPVGKKYTFNDLTMRVTKDAGYTLAFSYITGVIGSLAPNKRFQLQRIPVDFNSSKEHLKYMIISSKVST